MIDVKVKTLLTVVRAGSFTKAAEELGLTQPAVSHHIKQLEEEFGVRIFQRGGRELTVTAEGEILLKYAGRLTAVDQNCRQSLEDYRRQARHLNIGITRTAAENLMTQVLARYCDEHPKTHMNIITDTIQNLYTKLGLYELDLAIVEGVLPNSQYRSVLLDTDYLCLVVSPEHPFAGRQSVLLRELRGERLILRPPTAGTRMLFENFLAGHGESLENFNVMMEMDNIAMIKNLVAMDLAVSVIAHSACREELRAGRLVSVPIENASMTREINMVYHHDFNHMDLLEELRGIYAKVD
ncbi:LysR family transcriptional regulator [Pseudoflavonifractor phocaeensis]|uniref:LysR family transcriptional regulator n=1 Tax=Pseudoflavonifractor phocaeensis TaxID=1870988 RepID=UPI0030906075|nr:LysR family transcriptional regulator [Oscillospiraceae bacterium]